MKALGSKVHDLSSSFRDRQKEFLVRMKEISQGCHLFDSNYHNSVETSFVEKVDVGFTDDQLSMLDDAEKSADDRERQIAKIAKSVHELAQMWHESILVAEQGYLFIF